MALIMKRRFEAAKAGFTRDQLIGVFDLIASITLWKEKKKKKIVSK